MRDLREAPLELWDREEPLPAALEWGHRLDHGVQDRAYLALALHLEAAHVTADRRFWQQPMRVRSCAIGASCYPTCAY